ncbi:hypothetical protein CC117_20505 [Parafrankia colletiae]|uniref:Uncharacterized protein n=1 Tax=Parafrankia colletiae TaxID=573497 RepID=A0A1S1QR92_9ACTN|nr:hypothetical protein CC117_20505 [Parafrankia colletiae]
MPMPHCPLICGHEGAGVVTEVGPGVTSVQPGDHVAMSFVPSCGACTLRRTGRAFLHRGCPIAATGIANVWEIATQLRGEAGDRQIDNAKVGPAHVIGLGSACGVPIVEKAAV